MYITVMVVGVIERSCIALAMASQTAHGGETLQGCMLVHLYAYLTPRLIK